MKPMRKKTTKRTKDGQQRQGKKTKMKRKRKPIGRTTDHPRE
jgi:hypothetical protein